MGAYAVTPIPLRKIEGWTFGDQIAHRSGRFFCFDGVRVQTLLGATGSWSQPIIVQPEIGILGFVYRNDRGKGELLVQDKFEPGNSKSLQASCTVQATPSNFMRVHGGAATPYLRSFQNRDGSRVLVDRVQSEQGSWYLNKRNRNMIVAPPDPENLDVVPGYEWIPIGSLGHMVRTDETVNMNARSVLSSLAFDLLDAEFEGATDRADDLAAIRGDLRATVTKPTDADKVLSFIAWYHDWKASSSVDIRRTSLSSLESWRIGEMDITHRSGLYFRIVGAAIEEAGREVDAWMQPMLEPVADGTVALLLQRRFGELQALLCARVQPCLVDGVELGPTLQFSQGNYADVDALPPLAEYLSCPSEWVHVDAVQTEDGGRFRNACTRNVIVVLPDDHHVEHATNYRWVGLDIVRDLMRDGYRFNVEARSLFACLL